MIANLPPLIRSEFFNMIKFIFISGKSFALYSLLDKYLAKLSSLLVDGLEIKQLNMKLIVYIHSVIADAPARAKICNTKQFNGEFGCIHCMNEGVLIGRTRIYKGIEFIERTNALYNQQLEHCTTKKVEKFGIKGKSILEKFNIKLPTDVLNDYMHSCLEGVTKRMLNLWFNSNYHYEPYYLGRNINKIDSLLQFIKYPSEFTRTQRSLKFNQIFKANEYRNLIFYGLIYVLENFLPQEFYEHLLNFIIFLRLLTKDKTEDADTHNANLLVRIFVQNFEKLYDSLNLTVLRVLKLKPFSYALFTIYFS